MRIRILAISFFVFILWAIYQANTGAESQWAQLIRVLPYGDKVGHFLLFGILTLLVNMALNYSQIQWRRLTLLVGSVLVLGFVAVEEASQGYIPTRSMDIYDFVADCAGIFVFSLVSLKLAERARRASTSVSISR